ncbi:MAG: PH domain-containing protein [Tangfeifania sp.]
MDQAHLQARVGADLKRLGNMENFTNTVLIPENLPEVEPETFTGLNRKYLMVLFVRILIVFLLLAGAFAAYLILAEQKPQQAVLISIAAAILLIISFIAAVTWLGFPKKGYLVRDKDVSFQRGLITYKVTSVPLNRIQHVEINQGVLAKILGLSSVNIYTAGGTSSDLSIPGLREEEAQKLKAFLSGKISDHE